MKSERLFQVAVTTSREAEDAVAALLERLFGQPGSIYSAEGGTESIAAVYSSQPAERVVAKRHALAAGLQFLSDCGLNLGPAEIVIRKVPREDWSESWKKNFHAIAIGSELLIKPTWDRCVPAKGMAVVRLDPGMSFGTGQHPTTGFCLEQLVAARKKGQAQSLLDLGTGSGILAIAAVKLGYEPVRAVDNDPTAIRVAKANARLNRIAHKLTIVRGDLTRASALGRVKYDVVCANLTSDLLIQIRKGLVRSVRSAGKLVLAGILDQQFAEVQEAFAEAGFELEGSQLEKEWRSGVFAKAKD